MSEPSSGSIGWKVYEKVGPSMISSGAIRLMGAIAAQSRAKVIERGEWDNELEECLTDEYECVRLAAKARLTIRGESK
jgi:hypothetical protein